MSSNVMQCMYVCMYVWIYGFMFVPTYVYTYVYIYIYVCVRVRVRVRLCVNVYIYICIFTYLFIYLHANIRINRTTAFLTRIPPGCFFSLSTPTRMGWTACWRHLLFPCHDDNVHNVGWRTRGSTHQYAGWWALPAAGSRPRVDPPPVLFRVSQEVNHHIQ